MLPDVRVQNLSKRYRIKSSYQQDSFPTLRDNLTSMATAPMAKLRRWRQGGGVSGREEFWAIKDISFEVSPGEVIGFIGRNGAGKSTLLKILSRVTRPTSGRARLRGRVGSLLEVGTGFHPELSGRENIYLSGAILGMTRHEIRQRFDEIVAFAGVQKFLDTPIKRYSSGMNVRLGFAVAAYLDAKILLVDEVLAVGDMSFQKKCLSKMQDVAGRGRSILFVSHNMGAVAALCSRVLVLKDGRVRFDGPPQQAIDHYIRTALPQQADGRPVRILRDSFASDSRWRIDDLQLLGESGQPLQTISTGDYVCFRIHFVMDEAIPNAGFRLRLFTQQRQELFRVSTDPISGFHVPPLEQGKGHIDCVLPRFPLTAGTYYVDIGLTRPMVEFVHDVENAAILEIQAGDYYGSGQLMAADVGMFACEHHWSFSNGSEQ